MISFGRRHTCIKCYKLKVFSLKFSDSIFGQKNLRASDWMATSAKNLQHGSQQLREI